MLVILFYYDKIKLIKINYILILTKIKKGDANGT